MLKLSAKQNEMINIALNSEKEEHKPKEIYSYYLGSIIVRLNNGKHYKIYKDGEIKDSSYHDVIFDDPVFKF